MKRIRKLLYTLTHEHEVRIGGVSISESRIDFAAFAGPDASSGEAPRLYARKRILLEPDVISEGQIIKYDVLKNALRALRKAAEEAHVQSVIASIPSSLVYFEPLHFPANLDSRALEEAVRLQAESLFPVPSQETFSDWIAISSPAARTKKVLTGIARRSDILPYKKILEESGFTPVAIEAESLSISRLLQAESSPCLVLFVEPSECVWVGYCDGFPFFQYEIPRRILRERSAQEKSASEENQIRQYTENIAHSLQSGSSPCSGGGSSFSLKNFCVIAEPTEEEKFKDLFASNTSLHSAFLDQAVDISGVPSEQIDLQGLAAIGAAKRGTIPRREDNLLSIMDVSTETAYARAEIVSFVRFLERVAVGSGAFFAIAFAAMFLFTDFVGRTVDASAENIRSLPAETERLGQEAGSFNRQVALLALLDTTAPKIPEILNEIDLLKNPGVTFVSIRVESPSQIFVEGMALHHDALLALKATLENSSIFSFDPLPLSVLLGNKDVSFTLKLSLKNPEKFFPASP